MKTLIQKGKITSGVYELTYEINKVSKNLNRNTDLQPVNEYYTFSACGGKWKRNRKDYEYCGQCLDRVMEDSDKLRNDTTAQLLVKLWKQWHLNDLNAETTKQKALLQGFKGDYTAKVEKLGKDVFDEGYEYGTSWLVREIPEDILQQMLSLPKD